MFQKGRDTSAAYFPIVANREWTSPTSVDTINGRIGSEREDQHHELLKVG